MLQRGKSISMANQQTTRMRRLVVLLGMALIFSPCLRAQEATWRIDPLHSGAHFSVRHLMISTVRGEFTGVTGSVTYDPKDLARDTVEATIDCSTVNTGVAKRDAQLKSADFFDVARYPVMKFKSKRVEKMGDGLKVTGDLTINATTQEVVLDVEGPSASVRDSRGNEKIGLAASTQISRKKFGIIWNEAMESGGVAVADEVSVSLDLELIKDTKTAVTP
jgi:polyisoprenoid-binding protein YceI